MTSAAITAAPGVFVVLWSSGFLGTKLGLPYAEPMTFLFLRMAAVVALMALIVLATRPKWLSASGFGHSVVVGLLVHGCYLGGVFVAIQHGLPAGLAALVVSLQPVLTSTLASRLFGEPVSAMQWAGLLLGLAGVGLVVSGRLSPGGVAGEDSLFAWLAAGVALVGITIGTLYQKRTGGSIDWRSGMLVQYSAAGTAFGLGALAFETRVVIWSAELVIALAWLVVVLSFGAVWLLYWLIRQRAATRVASLFYLTPPVTALMSFAMFGERLDLFALFGMAVCVLGVALVNWSPPGRPDAAPGDPRRRS